MKSIVIALLLIFIVFTIGSNAFTSSNLLRLKEQQESYQACKSLKSKAPYLKLNCENLAPKKFSQSENAENSNIKILQNHETETRKVNKSEEIKLRNLIMKLRNQNVMRKD